LANNRHSITVDFPLGQEPMMSQVAKQGLEPIVVDPYEIGWYIESADEETYGPVSRQALRRFLEDKTITPNTLVRHCTQPEAKPAADQPVIMDQLRLDAKGAATGDRLAEAWPRKKRDQQALAEGSIPCAWHKQPAVLMCVRCHAPYCNRCRAKPFRKQFFLCRRCQLNIYNRRISALIMDSFFVIYVPIIATALIVAALGMNETSGPLIINVVNLGCVALLFFRDSLLGGAGLGKRATGLRVVQSKDGTTPLSHGQGFVRWLSQFIPIFNLVDASVPFRDPLLRRFGDRWAGTRVIDTARKLANARAKIARRLIKKGVQPPPELEMTMEGLARLA
jgi:uncharacterized RDD family membrane protein YckC